MDSVASKVILFTYELTHLNHSQKIRFFYEMHGRNGGKGVLDRIMAEKIAKSVVLVPGTHANSFCEFLDKWGCPTTQREMMEVPHE